MKKLQKTVALVSLAILLYRGPIWMVLHLGEHRPGYTVDWSLVLTALLILAASVGAGWTLGRSTHDRPE